MSGCARWPRRHVGSRSPAHPADGTGAGRWPCFELPSSPPAALPRARDPQGLPPLGRRTPSPKPLPSARGFLAIVSSPPPPSFPQQALDFPNCCWAWLLSQQTPSPKLGWVTRGKGHGSHGGSGVLTSVSSLPAGVGDPG